MKTNNITYSRKRDVFPGGRVAITETHSMENYEEGEETPWQLRDTYNSLDYKAYILHNIEGGNNTGKDSNLKAL